MFRVGAAVAFLMVSACAQDEAPVSKCAPFTEFAYQDFGPQSMAYDFLGNEIWQWQEQSGGDPMAEYPIQVIVYAPAKEAQAKARFVVDAAEQADFRYVSHSGALDYLEKNINELEELEADGMALGGLKPKLEKTKTRIIKEVCSQ